MQFKNNANTSLSLVHDIDFLCGSTSASYLLADKVRNVNNHYNDTARLIWDSADDWQYDDRNKTDTPKATRTVANASASYLLPTTAFQILGVEIKDANGDFWKLKPLDIFDINISPEEYFPSPGLPRFYDLEGNRIRLFPPPGTNSVTMSSGMVIRLTRDVNAFTTASTTTEPGFPVGFHRILSLGAALDFEEDPERKNFLAVQKDRLEKGLIKYYSTRSVEYKSTIKPYGKKRWRQYT